jgi:hypothetical protein
MARNQREPSSESQFLSLRIRGWSGVSASLVHQKSLWRRLLKADGLRIEKVLRVKHRP